MNDNCLPVWNPFQKGYFDNPHSQLSVLREVNPIHRGINGRWMLFGYDEVKFMLSNPVFQTIKLSQQYQSKNQFITPPDNLNNISDAISKWIFFLDPPEHTEVRNAVVKIWNSFNFSEFIEQVADEAIEKLAAKKEVEIINDFAVFIPLKIICKFLGLPFEDGRQLREWARNFAKTLEPFESLHDLLHYNQQAREFYEYIEGIIEGKRLNSDETFISQFLAANKLMAKPLNHEETVSVIIILFFTGIETSIYLFGQTVFYLIENSAQFYLLRSNLQLTHQATEELIRFISPTQFVPRIATTEVEIKGRKIGAGEMVIGSIASANRDSTIFENPNQLDFNRKSNPHISFGHGFHHCIGSRLAREELNTVLPKFVRAFSKIELDTNGNYEWEKNIINRGLKHLSVILNN